MRAKKLASRLDAIVKELEARGIGDFCECPNSEGIHAKHVVASKLFPEIVLIEDPVPTCNHHSPRPLLKPKAVLGGILLRLFPNFPPWIQSENGFATPLGSSFVEAFVSLPLGVRLERLDAISGENGEKQLKASRFVMSEYQVQ